MTGPEDSHSSTRPISVAELLAKNGTIGAPPVGGRRRRRRGDSDSISVAELTGEIPIISDAPHGEAAAPADDEGDEFTGPISSSGTVDQVVEEEPGFERPRRPHYAHAQRRYPASAAVGAEQMSPDPLDVDDDDEAIEAADVTEPALATTPAPETDDVDELPSYLRSTDSTLFGGQTVADDLARRRTPRYDDYDDLDVEDDVETAEETPMSAFVRGAWIVGQCIVAVAFGGGLFIAFDQLWKWNNIVALVLSVLVILGLVVGVRVVRKTEDIGSTLIAVAVGALVTLGPLALLQSG
ncbi:MAG: hypothetical protein ACRDU5_19600 [Mycobacterium sp.]